MEPHQCEKCGQSFSDSSSFASHPCSAGLTTPSSKKQLGNYKCSQCSEAFSKPGVLKRHFKSIHSGHDPKGPFPCSEQGCQFSSTNHQEYQAHMKSTHGLTLIPCTLQSCKVSFLTQGEMERHLRGHMPFGCFHCQFVAQNVKDLSDHLLEHNHLPTCAQGKQTLQGVGIMLHKYRNLVCPSIEHVVHTCFQKEHRCGKIALCECALDFLFRIYVIERRLCR